MEKGLGRENGERWRGELGEGMGREMEREVRRENKGKRMKGQVREWGRVTTMEIEIRTIEQCVYVYSSSLLAQTLMWGTLVHTHNTNNHTQT